MLTLRREIEKVDDNGRERAAFRLALMLLHVSLGGFCAWSAELEKMSQLRKAEEEDKLST